MSQRIAYITGEYPRATDTFIQREVAALRGLGMTVMTYSVRRTGPEHIVGPEQAQEQEQTFHILEAAKRPKTFFAALKRALGNRQRLWSAVKLAARTAPPGLRGALYQVFYFAEALVLADEMATQNVTHLHNHIAKSSCTVAMLASQLSGIQFSFTLHGPDIFFEPMHWRLDEKVAQASFVACISDFCRSQAMVFADRAHWDKLKIVHCGVDPLLYAETPPPGGQKLLFVGRLAAVKGVAVLLEALKPLIQDHPDVHLSLIGDGPERNGLEEQARALGLQDHVTFLGYRNQAEVADALAEHDLFVLPSFAEGVPVVLMEAMAAGRPVLTSRIAGVPELVDDGVSGLLVPPGNVDALGAALLELLKDYDLEIMGSAGRAKVVAEFDVAREAEKLAGHIEAVRP
ncbi:MAG: glycosyltransferase [Marinovum sp.]|nr:glycosyltransferase [Marinovum sp.]